MISNEGREFCRGIGLLAEHIICMADSFEEPIEKFRKSLFYSPEFEDKGKIIQDNIDTANRIRDEVKLISINDLAELHDTYGIALVEYIDSYTDIIPHDYDAVVTEATCTAMGFTTYTCRDCGDEYVSDYTDKLAHDYVETVTPATCTEFGFSTFTCADCDDSYGKGLCMTARRLIWSTDIKT